VTPVAPALASLTLTLRTAGGAFEEAASLGATFAEGLHIPCRVDPSSGAVSVSENATAPSVQQQQQQLPMPGLKGMVLVHTVWGSFLDGLGAPPRPPPAWLTPLGWLPLLRLCGPATRSLPPFCDLPPALRATVAGYSACVGGGYEYDGRREISPLDERELREHMRRIASLGIQSVAVSGVFSPVQPAQVGRRLRALTPKP